MSLWVGQTAIESGYQDPGVIDVEGLIPDAIRNLDSFLPPYKPVLKSDEDITIHLIDSESLKFDLLDFVDKIKEVNDSIGTGRIISPFTLPWHATYKINTETGVITNTPQLGEKEMLYIYDLTFNKRITEFGRLLQLAQTIHENIFLYCKFLADDKEIPFEYLGIPCNKEYPIDVFEFGVPSEPRFPFINVLGPDSVNVTWTKPLDHNTLLEDIVEFPFINNYKIKYDAVSSVRYPSFVEDSQEVINNDNTFREIIQLKPGHKYNFQIRAKNAANFEYGEYSNIVQAQTDLPDGPNFLDVSDDLDLLGIDELRPPYSSEGGYSLSGEIQVDNIINHYNINDIISTISTTETVVRRSNYEAGSTDEKIGTITAIDYTTNNKISVDLGGFGYDSQVGIFYNNDLSLIMNVIKDEDYYESSESIDLKGFWKSFSVSVTVNGTSLVPSENTYSLQISYDMNVINQTFTSPLLTYGVDNIQVYPIVDTAIMTNITTSHLGPNEYNYDYISGVPIFLNGTYFKCQFNITNLAHYFIRHDKAHAHICLKDEYDNNLSGFNKITQNLFNTNDHFYYKKPTIPYHTSTELYNNGSILLATENPPYLQINDFNIVLGDNYLNQFSENITYSVIPMNLYGIGSIVNGSIIDSTTGLSKGLIRLDTKSINTRDSLLDSNSEYGQHVLSGNDIYSTIEHIPVNHSVNIFLDTNSSELQLVNGTFCSPNCIDGYKNYNIFYYPGINLLPDYSKFNINKTYYTTFKYSNIINNAKGCAFKFIDPYGFNIQRPKDITLHIKLYDTKKKYTTAWYDANTIIGGSGVHRFNVNGSPCLNIESTSIVKYCYLPYPSTGTLYIKIGLNGTTHKRFKYIQLKNVKVTDDFKNILS